MANNNNNNQSVGMGCGSFFIVLLQVLFIALKLCGVIAWSWVVVLIPLFVYVGLSVLAVLFVLIVYLIEHKD